MGGIGSGTWCRVGTKTTTDDCKGIDIRYMKRNGLLTPGHSGSLSWKRDGKPVGDIRYQFPGSLLLLNYRCRVDGGEWESVEQSIPITTTACNYGNSRQWFECPHCSYRCAILYNAGTLFLCRKCYSLPYRSQMQGDLERLFDQKHSLGARIFEHYEHGEGWLKKKGMHQTTFDRLYSKYERLESRVNQGTIDRFGLSF